jgi:hypothetical protein
MNDSEKTTNEHLLGIAPIEKLSADLSALDDEIKRRVQIHDVIRKLAAAPVEIQEEYKAALVAKRWITAGVWRTALAEAKRDRAAALRDQAESDAEYVAGEDGCLYLKTDRGRLMIARFVPRVVSDVLRDDGAERTRLSRIRVTLSDGRSGEVDVAPRDLRDARTWAVQAAGPAAAVMAVSRAPEHVLAAAQILGSEHDRVVIYSHTGWKNLDGQWRFLSTSGALGSADLDDSVTVDLGSDVLNRYRLPVPGEVSDLQLRAAVNASLALMDLGDHRVTAALLAATYRAPLPLQPDCAVWFLGLSGLGKSTFAALCQQHYGADMDAKALPANWSSTGNALEATAFALANVLLVVDDYNPQGGERDQSAMKQAAERLVRGSANAAGRGRQRRDGTLAPQKFARAQLIATGEDTPPGQSLRARMLVTEVEAELVGAIAQSDAQNLAAAGTYALAMAGYVAWLAGRYDQDPDLPGALQNRLVGLRAELAQEGRHRRVAEGVASLLLGWDNWLRYAVAIGAVTANEAKEIGNKAKAALLSLGEAQAAHQEDADPVKVWCRSLKAAVTSGMAHLAESDTGGAPSSPQTWGWQQVFAGQVPEWRPQGRCTGWIHGTTGEVYLDAEIAHELALDHAKRGGTPIGFSAAAIRKRLGASGVIVTNPTEADRLSVKRSVLGKKKRVLIVDWERL